jgi:hypothetical protein
MMTIRSEALAQRVEQAHHELMTLIENLSDEEWKMPIPGDARPVGVILHHVTSVLPVETTLFKTLAAGNAITDVTLQAVDEMNAQHAVDHANCTREETLALLKRNSPPVLAAIRDLSDAELDRAAPVSLHWNAPLTTQYFIEEHPLSHSYRHATAIRAALGKPVKS